MNLAFFGWFLVLKEARNRPMNDLEEVKAAYNELTMLARTYVEEINWKEMDLELAKQIGDYLDKITVEKIHILLLAYSHGIFGRSQPFQKLQSIVEGDLVYSHEIEESKNRIYFLYPVRPFEYEAEQDDSILRTDRTIRIGWMAKCLVSPDGELLTMFIMHVRDYENKDPSKQISILENLVPGSDE